MNGILILQEESYRRMSLGACVFESIFMAIMLICVVALLVVQFKKIQPISSRVLCLFMLLVVIVYNYSEVVK